MYDLVKYAERTGIDANTFVYNFYAAAAAVPCCLCAAAHISMYVCV